MDGLGVVAGGTPFGGAPNSRPLGVISQQSPGPSVPVVVATPIPQQSTVNVIPELQGDVDLPIPGTPGPAGSAGTQGPAGPGGGPTKVLKAEDESVASSTAIQNDDELFLAVAANETWVLDYYVLIGDRLDLTGWKFAVSAPAGATVDLQASVVGDFGFSSNYGSHGSAVVPNSGNGAPITQFNTGPTPIAAAFLKAIIKNAGIAGTINLQWAQSTSDVNPVKVKAGSSLVANKMSP